MALVGWYYLHSNKSLIYKRELGDTFADLRESDFVLSIWPVHDDEREQAWNILVEALSLGVDKIRIFELASQWKCNDEDAEVYAKKIGCVLGVDGNQKTATRIDFDCLQTSPCGFGDTKLEAMADLCNQLGYKGGKMWQSGFSDLIK